MLNFLPRFLIYFAVSLGLHTAVLFAFFAIKSGLIIETHTNIYQNSDSSPIEVLVLKSSLYVDGKLPLKNKPLRTHKQKTKTKTAVHAAKKHMQVITPRSYQQLQKKTLPAIAKTKWGKELNLLSSPTTNNGRYTHPHYPRFSRINAEEGLVKIGVQVHKGVLTQLKIIATSGYKRLDQAALNAINRWVFPADFSKNFIQSVKFQIN